MYTCINNNHIFVSISTMSQCVTVQITLSFKIKKVV